MSQLSGPERARLKTALVNAFAPTDMVLLADEYLNCKFFNKVSVGPGITYDFQIFEFIQHFEMRDTIADLVAAVRARRPKNLIIADIAETLGLTTTGPRFDPPPAQPNKTLEELIRRNVQFIEPVSFRERQGSIEGQVCWIGLPGGGGGTGFLVGPDLVLTNQHVVKRLVGDAALAPHTLVRFDYKQTDQGKPVLASKVTEVRLAGQWLVDSSPPSKKDWDATLGDAGLDELDFALVRLATKIGDEPVGGSSGDQNAQPRGWIDVAAAGLAPDIGQQIFIFQHPDGEPLRLSVGTITEYNGNKSRVRYDANTKDGSSGSPCFNASLQLCALHHAHDTNRPPRWNQAVPIGAILGRWHYPAG
jgi:hypothetical protein